MPITFKNNNDVIVYALETVISYARQTLQIFVAQFVWWLASIIGLEQGLINHINNLQGREDITAQTIVPTEHHEVLRQDPLAQTFHPDRVAQISNQRSVSAVPRDLTEDQPLDRILESAERVIKASFRDNSVTLPNRVNPLPSTKTQLMQGRKAKRLREARNKHEADLRKRLRETRIQVLERLTKEDNVLIPGT
jgi:hypothetical protein